MAHGIFFTIYIVLAIILKLEQNWSFKKFAIIVIAAIVPLGTFYVDKKYLKDA
jgi:integral membrane protein